MQFDYSSHWYSDDQVSYLEKSPARHHHARRMKYLIDTITRFNFRHPLILDAGCGDGALIKHLLTIKGAKVVGLDYNPLRLSRARSRFPRVRFVQGNLLKTPFADNSFDILVSHHVLEHIRNDRKALREFLRILKPGGHLILGVPNEGSFICQVRNKVIQPEIMQTTDHVHFYTAKSISDLIVSIPGFEVERVDVVGGTLFPHYKVHMFLSQFKLVDDFFNYLAQIFPALGNSLFLIAKKKSVA